MNTALSTDRVKPKVRLSRMTLRRALIALGVTDAEMRFRRGAKSILDGWTGEEKDLLALAHRKWRQMSAKYHEANGGDPADWAMINACWAEIERKMKPYTKTRVGDVVDGVCKVCGKAFQNKTTGVGSFRRSWCSKECNDEMQRRWLREWRRKKIYDDDAKRVVPEEHGIARPLAGGSESGLVRDRAGVCAKPVYESNEADG